MKNKIIIGGVIIVAVALLMVGRSGDG